jgi:ribonuclease/clavin/mitogillin
MTMSELNALMPGLRRIALDTPTLLPATSTNAYVLGTKSALVVEPASPHPHEQVRLHDALAREGVSVGAVFITHHHVDHIGGVDALRTHADVPVWAHAETAKRLPFAVDRVIEEGDEFESEGVTWRALHTPGHAPGHVCLLSSHGALIAGDMVAGTGTILIDPVDGDMAQYLASLRRLSAHKPARLFPSHGPSLDDGHVSLDRYVAHRLAREARVFASLEGLVRASLEALADVAYADAPNAPRMVVQASLLSHLRKLADEGRVQCEDERWSIVQ